MRAVGGCPVAAQHNLPPSLPPSLPRSFLPLSLAPSLPLSLPPFLPNSLTPSIVVYSYALKLSSFGLQDRSQNAQLTQFRSTYRARHLLDA